MSSIQPNGAPLGTQGVTDLADTPSWRSPTDYFDPLTGKVWSAPTLAELLEQLEANDVKLFDQAEMLRQGKTTDTGRPPRFEPGNEWERLLIRLDNYEDPEKARQIIVNVLSNPDVTIAENKGGGRVRKFDFKGRRAVIAHEVHHDDERGPHFMAQVHISGLDAAGNILPRASFKKSEHKDAMMEQINAALEQHGLAKTEFVARGADNGALEAERRAQLTPQQVEEYREAADKGELPPLLDEDAAAEAVDQLPASTRKENLRQAAQAAGAQAASLYAQAQALQKQNAMYRQALRALEAEEQHLARIASLNNRLEQAAEAAAQAEAQHAAVVAEQAQAVETARAEVVEVSATLEATQQHAAQVSEQLNDTREQLAGVETELAQATEANEQLTRDLEAERTARAEEAKAHEADLAEVRADLDQANKDKTGLESRLEKVRADLADERTAHGATQAELKTTSQRADEQARRAQKAEADLAAMREQLAVLQAQAKTQAEDLARERKAREDAERMARDAQGEKAKAEAQRDARPTQADLQAALADKAKAEGQRDQLRERLEALLAERKPEPGNEGPKA